ncbi:MAG TPA: hypothetical protein VGM54_22710 [Chthoniobacter sp.]|jgi:hypothetical protein
MKPLLKEVGVFFTIALALCWFVFGDAMLGRQLLAGVDLAPANWSQYHFVDPETNGIAWTIHHPDQLFYDLPNQYTIYHAYRAGIIPWWDPYTYCGRPLIADAHVSAGDPVRIVCFSLLPDFVLAYNWVFIAHFLIGGVSYFCLLRGLGVGRLIAGGIALAGAFAGYLEPLFGYPWLHGSFIYYPWLWLGWHRLWTRPAAASVVMATLAAACALYAGNLQSHSYLVLFAGAFLLGYGRLSWSGWKRGITIVLATGLIAALLAAPMLIPELELFRLSQRTMAVQSFDPKPYDGVAMLTAIWPWWLGTSRTFSYRLYNFYCFIGTAALIFAALGFRAGRKHRPEGEQSAWWCALIVFVTYLLIMSIRPLAVIFYYRSAGLMVLGAVVLSALGAERWMRDDIPQRQSAKIVGGFAALVAVGTLVLAFVVYPRIKPRLVTIMVARLKQFPGTGTEAFRRAQVENYPSEIGFANPEVLVNWLALVVLVVLLARPASRRYALPLVLLLNMAGPVLHARKYLPRVSRVLWDRLLAGGPEQQAICARVNPQFLRVADEANDPFQIGAFISEFAQFYKVHVVHGYAALVPPTYYHSNCDFAEWEKYADFRRSPGHLQPRAAEPPARFQWQGEGHRSVEVIAETLNTMDVQFGDGPAGWVRRTDTPYPGWHAMADDGTVEAIEADGGPGEYFTRIQVPAKATRLHLRYEPTGLRHGIWFAGLGLLALVGWGGLAAVSARASERKHG